MMVRALRRHAAAIWLGLLALAIAGGHAIAVMPSGIYPEMTFQRVIVVAHAEQLPPDLVEAQITRPLEAALAVVPGVRHVRAKTIRGATELSLQLTDHADPLATQSACRAAIDQVELPRGATTRVERVLPTSVPSITFNVSGKRGATVDPRRLRDVAERVIKPAFVRVPGVGGVEVQGGRVREVEILVDPTRLAALHITPSQLADRVEQADQRVAAGRVFDQHQTLPVVLDAQATDLAALSAIPIASGPTGPVTLGGVAEITEGAEDPDVLVRGPTGEVVAVSVARLPGASTTDVVAAIEHAAARLARTGALPPDIELTPVYDQAALVDASLHNVRDAILLGIVLSLVVIAFALRDVRAGVLAALPVPLTLLATFAVAHWLGITLNLMSLGGIAIAIGLVVDDAIVVTEGIVARIEAGHASAEAIELGVDDMFAAVVGTTLTTIVVFAPLALLSGMTGHFLGAFALMLVIAVALSMIVAFATIPLLAGLLKPRVRRDRVVGQRLTHAIAWCQRHRWLAPAVIVVMLGLGALAQRSLATGFLPAMDEGAFVADFTLPAGTSLEETDRIGEQIDRALAALPEVATFTRRTGTELGPLTATLQNTGDIMIRLVDRSRRGSVAEVIDHVRDTLAATIPEARFEYMQVLQDVLADLAGNPEPIEVRVLGEDTPAIEAWATAAGERLGKRAELTDVFDGREGASPILRSRIDAGQLARLGLDAGDVAADLHTALAGREVGEILRPERTIGVRLRYPDRIRFSAPALASSQIAYGPATLALQDVVLFDRPLAPAVLRRDGLRKTLRMTAAATDGDLGGAVAAVQEVARQLPLPPGAVLEIGGQAATSAQARSELLYVALAAAALVLLVLLVQLRSVPLALIILVTAPLSTVGGLLALAAAGMPLDISAMTGLVLLVGLVVKNGILLLEYLQRDLAAGVPLGDALTAAARRRLRPIVMTTAATLAGLAPLAIGLGAGAELQRPLAVCVIGGLVLASVLSLVVLPGLAVLVLRRRFS